MSDKKMGIKPIISGITATAIKSFIAAVVCVTLAGLCVMGAALYFVKDTAQAMMILGAITGFVLTVVTSLIGFASVFLQVRGEMNHRFDQLLDAKVNIGFNEGLEESEAGGSIRRVTGDSVNQEKVARDHIKRENI